MRHALILLLVMLPFCLFAQLEKVRNTYVGLNLTPLMMNTLDLRYEQQLHDNMSLNIGAGGRYHNRGDNSTKTSLIGVFDDYIFIKNTGAFLSAGVKFHDKNVNETPYIGIDVIGHYYQDRLYTGLDTIDGTPTLADPQDFNGFDLGVSGTIGFMFHFAKKRLMLDLALQIGYAKAREEINTNYIPGLGYSTYGLVNLLSVPGMYMRPIVALKYNIKGGEKSFKID